MAKKITEMNVMDVDIDKIDKKFEKMSRKGADSLRGTSPSTPKKTVKKTTKRTKKK